MHFPLYWFKQNVNRSCIARLAECLWWPHPCVVILADSKNFFKGPTRTVLWGCLWISIILLPFALWSTSWFGILVKCWIKGAQVSIKPWEVLWLPLLLAPAISLQLVDWYSFMCGAMPVNSRWRCGPSQCDASLWTLIVLYHLTRTQTQRKKQTSNPYHHVMSGKTWLKGSFLSVGTQYIYICFIIPSVKKEKLRQRELKWLVHSDLYECSSYFRKNKKVSK